ncbi:MAG: hypothetical protein Q7Q73_13695 [Verrucomicrobiota bacterium JB024]|nr:hypothetical protein [Verrucomicrobiota bacterium JB024]
MTDRSDSCALSGKGREIVGCNARCYRLASLVLFVLVAIWGLWALPDYGISWDEYFRWQGGQQKLLYYQVLLDGGDAQAVLPAEDAYPGLFDLSVALANEVLPFGLLALGHGLSLACGLAAVAGAWAIGRLLGGQRLAFWCALFLFMTPRFFGHMFFNPKDIPFAAGMIWSLYFLLRWGRLLPRPRLGATLTLGVVIGLTLALRIGGMVFFGYVAGYVGYALVRELIVGRGLTRTWWGSFLRVGGHALLVLVVAFIVLVPWWPAIHSNPLVKPFEALSTVSQYPWNGLVLFAGESIHAPALPWYYPLTWLAITLPDFLLVILAAGVILLAVNFRFCLRAMFSPRGFPWVVVATAFAFPLAYVIARDSVLYDGIRHLLFILPPLACMGALAWVSLLDLTARSKPILRVILGGALTVLMLMQVWVLYRLHPYEYVYFNQLGGGMADKAGRYETEYWGTSMREACLWLDQYVPEGEYRVAVAAPPWMTDIYLPERFKRVRMGQEPDFFLSLTRQHFDQLMEGRTVYVVERFGLPFTVVKEEPHLPAAADRE